jgi:hypothetical protein
MRYTVLLLCVFLASCGLELPLRAFDFEVSETSPGFGGPTLCVDGLTQIKYRVAFRVPVRSWTVKATTSNGRTVGSKNVQVAHSPDGLQPVTLYYQDQLSAQFNLFSQAITPVELPKWQLNLEAIPVVPDPDRPGNIVVSTGLYEGVRCSS